MLWRKGGAAPGVGGKEGKGMRGDAGGSGQRNSNLVIEPRCNVGDNRDSRKRKCTASLFRW